MSFNVQDFKSNLNRGVARPSLFEVFITTPTVLGGISSQSPAWRFVIEGAELPGKSLATQEYRKLGYGPQQKMPYVALYSDISLGVRATSDLNELKFFSAWMDQIITVNKNNSADNTATLNGPAHHVGYFRDYVSTIQIHMYDEGGNQTDMVELIDAYPTIVNTVPLSWNANDQYVQFQIVMSYRYWIRPDTVNNNVDQSKNQTNYRRAFGSLIPLVSLATGLVMNAKSGSLFNPGLIGTTMAVARTGSNLLNNF